MKSVGKIFLSGLVAVAPVGVTVYVLYWLGATTESLLGPVVADLTGWQNFFGSGIAAAVIFVFVIGVLTKFWFIRYFFRWGEKLLERIPLVKTLYGSIRDLMGFFAVSEKKQSASQVVMVTMKAGDTDLRLVGLLTRKDFSDLPDGVGSESAVAVYLPMSYQIGGFMVVVPKSAVEPVDMSMEEAMRFVVTAGMTSKKSAPGGAMGGVAG